jgi:hypothetical protein
MSRAGVFALKQPSNVGTHKNATRFVDKVLHFFFILPLFPDLLLSFSFAVHVVVQ